ncbi:MAG TPA: FtsX-like permease family protein [Streptosporangiaceae bacterium]|nr:FtsX-like permease family protein [Streptosporangiaceae bacterium]
MNAHRLVIIAAAFTIAVAAALATALVTFSSQALPRAVRHDLSRATDTSFVIRGNVSASQGAQYTSLLPGKISAALEGAPFAYYRAYWSDPLGFVAGSRPAEPGNTRTVQTVEAATLQAVAAQAALVSGHWPADPPSGGPVPAALPVTAASLLHVRTGDTLQLRDRISDRLIRFTVTGLYRPRQVSSPYWGLNDVALSGSTTISGFTTYGPLTVTAAAFRGPLTMDGGSWVAVPRTADIPAGLLRTVAANVSGLRDSLAGAVNLPDLTMTTGLPAVVSGTANNLDVARSLLAICAVLLFLLAAAALLAVARLLAGQREGESAMLVARGAARRQLARLTAVEAAPVCVLSAAAGGLAGIGLARLLAGSGAALFGWPAFWAAATVGAGAQVIMLVPVLSTVTPGAARARRGRQAAIAGVTRAGADLALILLAVVAGWQLRHYSAVSAGAGGTFGVDPVIVAAPALALAGGTVLALRLLPAGGKAGDRLAARGRRLTAAMASWQISRQPVRQGGAALLIVLAVATGTLALSQRQSWTRSVHDQAAFSTGADVRVQTSQPLSAAQAGALARAPGVRQAMPVASFEQTATSGVTLAVDSGRATDVTLLRPDQSPVPAAGLFGKIRPQASATPPGVILPGRAGAFSFTARLGPAALRLGEAAVTVSIEDADSDVYQVGAGSLPADGRDHTLTASLGSPGGAIYPLRLASISLQYTLPARKAGAPAVFTLDRVSGAAGTAPVPGTALRDWPAVASSAELADVRQFPGTAGPAGQPAVASSGVAGTGLAVTFSPGYGLAAGGTHGTVPGQLTLTPRAPAVLPGLATQRFLSASNANVGMTVQTFVNGTPVSVKIVAAVSNFPTVSGRGGALVVDLGSVQAMLARGGLEPAPVTQWWLATPGQNPDAPGPAPPGLSRLVPPGSAVTSASGTTAALLADPLSTLPQQGLLAVTIAAAVLAITGFCVSIAAGVRQRRTENALLAALGVAPRAAAGQVCLEKLMLSVPSALAGLVLGVVLAELLVPAITLTSAATRPVPPVLIQFAWSQTLLLALAVAVLPVLAAALTLARRPDAAAELRAAEAA